MKKFVVDQTAAWLFAVFLTGTLFGLLLYFIDIIAKEPSVTVMEHLGISGHAAGEDSEVHDPQAADEDHGQGPVHVSGHQEEAYEDGVGAEIQESSSEAVGEAVSWSYRGQTAPEFWGRLSQDFLDCQSGRQQSPIDLNHPLSDRSLPVPDFRYEKSSVTLQNTGYGITAMVSGGNDLLLDADVWHLTSLSFHGPSEHTVDGIPFDMELQLQHQKDDGSQLILAVFLEEGHRSHSSFTRLLDQIPQAKGQKSPEFLFNIRELIPDDLSYFSYTGSMTIPPCREGVNWLIMRQPLKISSDQVDQFIRVYRYNARPVQSIHRRTVRIRPH